MTDNDFENQLVVSLNEEFKQNGIAYRRKQAKFTSQKFDVIVDDPYLAIECKSIDYRNYKKLYFSQHFSDNQIDKETEFLNKSGREGFLAVELRRGRGKKRLYLGMNWHVLIMLRHDEFSAGIDLTDREGEKSPFAVVEDEIVSFASKILGK